MSGDVQPRKRKDKKRKKDELGIEEPRGTAAALGEGDVFMHSYHDHGTGGHWCAKIIFFSLLAVLLTLIGLIILENRGLSELEANAVESRYSGVLEGWLEDAPDDDHHDAHTLDLKHHDEEDEHDENEEEDEEIEVEKIEQEASDEEPISTDLPALPEDDDDDDKEVDNDDDDDDNKSQEDDVDDADNVVDGSDDADDDFLEADEPEIERISAPAGKPFVEVEEDDTSSEKPTDTLEEEEEYEKQQEELRKEEEESTSHIWLKLSVGGALLAATHALVRRAAGPRDEAEEEHNTREETPVVDRRMTLIPEEHVLPKKVAQESAKPKPFVEEVVKHVPEILKSTPIAKQEESEEEEEIEEPEVIEEEVEEIEEPKKESKHEKDKELYSDEEEVEDEEEEVPEPKTPAKPAPEPEADDDVPDDVEIIDEEELEDELEEEEEEVSDVDDTELLSRLEAKYGRLPEPERPGQKHKDGGNSLEDQWPGEPSDAFWRQELDSAEERLRQDWLD